MGNENFTRELLDENSPTKKVIGFTVGAWDLLHAGHIIFLKEARNRCDKLIVGLHINPSIQHTTKKKPIQSVVERMLQLEGCRWVDGVFPYETEEDLELILRIGNFDVRFLGSDYFNKEDLITGIDLCHIEYISREHHFSSSELRNRIVKEDW